MKWALEDETGKFHKMDSDRLRFNEYQLARLFGWTPQQVDDAPGHWCDWALAFAGLERQVRRG